MWVARWLNRRHFFHWRARWPCLDGWRCSSPCLSSARPGVWPVTQYVIPGLIAVAYGLLWWGGRGAYADGGFGSIPEVRVWFANDYLLTAGWLHYLAFDLFIGTWICRDAGTRRIHPLLVLPTLPLTFMFGPLGLLLWFVVRAVARVTASKE